MKKYEKINKFIDKSPQRSIFCYPWWLEAVAPGRFDYIVSKKKEKIQAIFPIVTEQQFVFKKCNIPPFTQYLGVLLPEMTGKQTKILSKQHRLITNLIDEIPKCSYYNFKCHFNLKNWLPFYWNDFNQTTRYTYLLKNIKEQDKIWDQMHSNTRRSIRKAQRIVMIKKIDDIKILIKLHEKTLNRKNKNLSESKKDTISRIYSACKKREKALLLAAYDENENIHSSQLFVWDDRMSYYLIGGNNPDYLYSYASYLLLWEGIKYCSQKVDDFNFEGSMLPGVEQVFRKFGGIQKQYFQISKFQPKWLEISKFF